MREWAEEHGSGRMRPDATKRAKRWQRGMLGLARPHQIRERSLSFSDEGASSYDVRTEGEGVKKYPKAAYK